LSLNHKCRQNIFTQFYSKYFQKWLYSQATFREVMFVCFFFKFRLFKTTFGKWSNIMTNDEISLLTYRNVKCEISMIFHAHHTDLNKPLCWLSRLSLELSWLTPWEWSKWIFSFWLTSPIKYKSCEEKGEVSFFRYFSVWRTIGDIGYQYNIIKRGSVDIFCHYSSRFLRIIFNYSIPRVATL